MGEKIKILHLVEAFGGGVFFFLSDLVNATDKNYEITIAYGIRKETPDNFKEYFEDKVKFVEIKNFTRSINPVKDFKAMREIKKLVKELNPNVVHMHSSKAGALGRLAIRAKKVKLLYNPHGFSFLKQDDSLLKRIMYKVLEKILAFKNCTIIGCSQGEYEEARKLTKNSICISNGVNIPKLKKASEGLQVKNINAKKLKICTCARITYPKNPKMFNEIAKSFPEIEFTWIGDGELREELTANNINITGWKEKKELLKIINENDIFILPSLWEGLPLALLEAMYMNKVCIVSNCIGNRDVINNKQNGFICRNLEDYINVINDIKNGYKGIENIQIKAKESVEKIYNTSVMAEQYDTIYKVKKVMHLICTDVFSGAENVACQIINGFKNEIDYDMVYCSPEGKNKKCLEDRNVTYLKLNKFNFKYVKKAIKTFNPTIIHAHDIKASIMAALFCNKHIKIISHIHGNHENMRKINIKTILYNFFSKKFEHIIWVSKSALDNYIFNKNVKDKSIVLYNVIDGKEILNKIKSDDNNYEHYDAIFLGRLSYPKNPERLLNLINRIKEKNPNFKLAIVGSGELENDVKNKINELHLENNIKMYGFMDNPYKVLNSSKIMILTSRYEGTPMCALEAMSLGKPIISTPTDGLKDIIVQGFNGYLSENDTELEKCIIDLMENTPKLQELSQNALIQFGRISNIKKYVDELKKKYN